MNRTITITQAATQLGLSPRRVRELAASLGVGVKVTPRMMLLAASEVQRIERSRKPAGNPNFIRRK